MNPLRMKATKCPTDELSLTNCAITNPSDWPSDKYPHIKVATGPSADQTFVFTVKNAKEVAPGFVGFGMLQRKWAVLSLNQDVEVRPHQFDPVKDTLATIVLEADFLMKKNTTLDPYDSDAMAREFLAQFYNHAFSVGQQLAFQFQEKKMLGLVVKELEVADINAFKTGAKDSKPLKVKMGRCIANTAIVFDKAEGSSLNLVGKSKGKAVHHSIINPDWDFQNMGVGGLDKEFNAIFRRAFASRVFPPEVVEQLGCKHVKGILLYGPPGTGKTLMARQIGKMLNAREPKIVNGPQILDKYVGESEADRKSVV